MSKKKKDSTRRGQQYAPSTIINWREYNQALCRRGSITFWIDPDVARHWHETEECGRPGAPRQYSDFAIKQLLLLQAVYHLPCRQVIGFTDSLFQLMGLPLRLPHYSQLCRRAKRLDVDLGPLPTTADGPLHIVLDSTGLKVHGEGEWKETRHGLSKRKTWIKLHIAVDVASQKIVAQVTTKSNATDAAQAARLMEQSTRNCQAAAKAKGVKPAPRAINRVGGDGSYDKRKVHAVVAAYGAAAIIPPQRNAVEWAPDTPKSKMHPRTAILRRVNEVGVAEWKKESGYHRRSLVETAFFRYKQVVGGRLRRRLLSTQKTEVAIACKALNLMNSAGMPVRRRLVA